MRSAESGFDATAWSGLVAEASLLRDDATRAAIAAAAGALGRPRAAQEIAAELVRMGSRPI